MIVLSTLDNRQASVMDTLDPTSYIERPIVDILHSPPDEHVK
eukprot:gene8678-1070_t